MTILNLKCNVPGIEDFYLSRLNHESDSGVDLYITEDITIYPGETKIIDLGVSSKMTYEGSNDTIGYYMYPRSSISKTPLVLANGTGIIDKDYRGNLKIALKYVPTNQILESIINNNKNVSNSNTNTSDSLLESYSYTIKKGIRLVQICAPDLKPVKLKLVETLDSTERGTGGFGSTGL